MGHTASVGKGPLVTVHQAVLEQLCTPIKYKNKGGVKRVTTTVLTSDKGEKTVLIFAVIRGKLRVHTLHNPLEVL